MNDLELTIPFVGRASELTRDFMEEYIERHIPAEATLDSWEVKPLRRQDISPYEKQRKWRWVGDIIATVVIE